MHRLKRAKEQPDDAQPFMQLTKLMEESKELSDLQSNLA